MLQHAVLWNYASVWKPGLQAADAARGWRSAVTVDDDPAQPERVAFASLMRKVHAGAAPAWWAMADRAGHG